MSGAEPIHEDLEVSRAAGFEDVFAPGMLVTACLGQALIEAISPDRPRAFSTRFVAITRLGDEIRCEGEGAEIPERDGVRLARFAPGRQGPGRRGEARRPDADRHLRGERHGQACGRGGAGHRHWPGHRAGDREEAGGRWGAVGGRRPQPRPRAKPGEPAAEAMRATGAEEAADAVCLFLTPESNCVGGPVVVCGGGLLI